VKHPILRAYLLSSIAMPRRRGIMAFKRYIGRCER
jgi:hypothetical protein